MEPVPPYAEAPPMKHAAIASISNPTPTEGPAFWPLAITRMLAKPARTPMRVYALNITFLVSIPESLVAFSLPPTA